MQRGSLDIHLVLAEAAALANEAGLANLSLKALAERLNIKSPSLYNHITSLDELKQELMAYGWGELCRQLEGVLIGESGDEALSIACSTFYEYAVRNPGVFEAMAFCNRNDGRMNTEASRAFMGMLIKVLGKRNIREENACHVMRLVRSFIEGFALLVNNRAFDESQYAVRESFDFGVGVILDCLHKLESEEKNADGPASGPSFHGEEETACLIF